MSTTPEHVDADDPELVAIMGPNLTAQFTPAARATLKWEATKHPGGVARVVAAVIADPSIRNHCAVILDRITREQHHDLTSPTERYLRTPRRDPFPYAPLGERPTCPTCGRSPYGPHRNPETACRTCGRDDAPDHARTPPR